MPKAPGSSDPEWIAVDELNKTFPSFIKWITKYHKKSLKVIAGILDDPEAMEQLRYGAAKEVNALALRFYKEFRGAVSQDFVRKSPYELHKETLAKQHELGIKSIVTPLLQTKYIPEEADDDDNGTEG